MGVTRAKGLGEKCNKFYLSSGKNLRSLLILTGLDGFILETKKKNVLFK